MSFFITTPPVLITTFSLRGGSKNNQEEHKTSPELTKDKETNKWDELYYTLHQTRDLFLGNEVLDDNDHPGCRYLEG